MSRTTSRLIKRIGLFGVVLAVAGGSGSAGAQESPALRSAAADTITPLRCAALTADPATASISRSGGPGTVNLRWPDGNAWIAQLTIGRAAVGPHEELHFTMEAPAGTPYAFVEITARNAQGQPVTTFDDDLRLVLRPHDRGCQPSQSEPGARGVYLYNIGDRAPADEMIFGENELARGGELLLEGNSGERRSASLIRDFSGFILAQGRR